MSDFELVNGTRGKGIGQKIGEFVEGLDDKSKGEIIHAAAENFGAIVNLAGQIADIRKVYAESDKQVAEINAKKELLIAETDQYIKKIEAETQRKLENTEKYRMMLNDFYTVNPGNLSSEAFVEIMKMVIESGGK